MPKPESAPLSEAEFLDYLSELKAKNSDISWYPFSELDSFLWQIKSVMNQDWEPLVKPGIRVLDVGSGDGDLSFYLETQGCTVHVLDNESTNYNRCRGVQRIKRELRSNVEILVQNIDYNITLPGQYDLAFACGVLYHLRNPIYLLIQLALHAEHLVLSTRTAHKLPDGTDISKSGVAYLLDTYESKNRDCTNFWIFSPVALNRCLRRSGWNVLRTCVFGAGHDSDPVEHDQRTVVFCKRVHNYADLLAHYDF